MSNISADKNPHHVLQLHGGGTLVLAEIIKCAVLERTTGQKIRDLFETSICDSGGAIARLCLEKISAEDLLKTFADIIGNTFPSRSFYYNQTLSRGPRRFDNSVLQNQIKAILEASVLEDFKGNLFVGAHHYGQGAVTFEKFTAPHEATVYENTVPQTTLMEIAVKTSTIPGLYQEQYENDPTHVGGTYLDSIINQNPSSILSQIKSAEPDRDIFYVQMGNIEDRKIVNSILKRSILASRYMNSHWKYVVNQTHSAHLKNAGRVIGKQNIVGLITDNSDRFSPADPSIDQLTRVILVTLDDISKRQDEYEGLSTRLNRGQPLDMDVHQAIEELKTVLDPLMKKRKLILSRGETIPEEFPSPEILWAQDSAFYKPAYRMGELAKSFAPNICKYLIESDFRLGDAFQAACKSGLKKLIPSPHKTIEPK